MIDIKSNKDFSHLGQKFFWRFIFLFLVIYIIPYDLAFGFTDKFEEWRLWHKPIFWIGEETPLVGWDSKFEVCRYIFIFLLGTLLTILWLFLDSFYLKMKYEEKLASLTQTFLRYRIAIVMLHYGLAKVFMHQFGTIDISTLESTIGEYQPMGLMWSYLSFSEEIQLFSGWIETIGAILLFFRRATFLGTFLLVIALANVVLWDIGFSVSVTLYAIQLLLLTLVLMSSQFKSIYNFLIKGKSSIAVEYKALVTKAKYIRVVLAAKLILFIGLIFLFAKDAIKVHKDYFSNNYEWFTGLHNIDLFIINGDSISTPVPEKKWKKIIFNDVIYFNDSFKIEFDDSEEERFKYKIDSITKMITYRDYEDEKAPWSEMTYHELGENKYLFKGVFKSDTISAKTTIKRFEDYNLISNKGSWLIDWD